MKTINSTDFYQKHLDRVSRSFAFCIRKLETPMRTWVSLTYLVCRILDTVEDAPWKKHADQQQEFDHFDHLLNSPEGFKKWHNWQDRFPRKIPAGEKVLLKDTDKIFAELHGAPPSVKEIIQDMVSSMSLGMQYFSRKKVNGELHLRGLPEVNQYCFFVAGLVGEALSKLLLAVDHQVKSKKDTLVNAHHFGLFLQKVNLLKDQLGDEKEGRFFIPDRGEVFASLANNAWGAKAYIDALPLHHRGYRVFCAWSFYLGLASLPYIQEAYRQATSRKISRSETKALIARIEDTIDDPNALNQLFNELYGATGLPTPLKSTKSLSANAGADFSQYYKGSLNMGDFQELGLVP